MFYTTAQYQSATQVEVWVRGPLNTESPQYITITQIPVHGNFVWRHHENSVFNCPQHFSFIHSALCSALVYKKHTFRMHPFPNFVSKKRDGRSSESIFKVPWLYMPVAMLTRAEPESLENVLAPLTAIFKSYIWLQWVRFTTILCPLQSKL